MPELTPDTTSETTLTELSRRRVLRVAAVSGAGALLVACGGDDTATDSSDQGSGGSSSTPAGTSSSAAESDEDAGGGGGGGLVATADVPVKGGVVLDDKKIVVTQPASGEFKAFTAVCTHQSCTVASVKANTITCPCHGSTYSALDGSVQGGPAPSPLREIAVTVEGDQVVRS
ncbi:MAG TPA: Rieske (2Fe-2S) protein [Actinomycetes bacterium]|nr:Rieske (2Fe-2S) protein [Actinomycetes bacterium]